jgi:excisionase family DNA binding protein
MAKFSTRQAAQKLGVGMTTLTRYIEDGKIPAPKATVIGRYEIRAWSEEDIERVRALLPKIANGIGNNARNKRDASPNPD